VLVDDVDGAVGLRHQERAGQGFPRDAPPRDARETPNEARHGGGGGEAAEESLERSRAPRMLRAVTSLGRLGLGLFFLSAYYKSHAGLYILERTKSYFSSVVDYWSLNQLAQFIISKPFQLGKSPYYLLNFHESPLFLPKL